MDRPTFNIYHANGKGTGTAMKVELHPAEGTAEGSVVISLVRQTSVATREGCKPVYPTFGWGDRISVKLDPIDVERVIEVFAGETMAINDGKGLFHKRADGTTAVFKLCHHLDPVPCYLLTIEKTEDGETDQRNIALSPTEAGMLYHGLVASMGMLMFGGQGWR